MTDRSSRILVAADSSNLIYQAVFSSKKIWMKEYPEESSFMENKWRTDQGNLPNLLNFQSFRRILSRKVQESLESVLSVSRKFHQTEIDSAEGLDVFLVEDSPVSGNFRKALYPEYKQQRKAVLQEFDVWKSFEYARTVVFSEIGVVDKMGWHVVRIPECESDDIISVLMSRYKDYMLRILISQDKDFLQIPGIFQYSPWGNRIEASVNVNSRGDKEIIDPKDLLLLKILMGDPSDNIRNVFPGYGKIKCLRLVKDRETLKKMLKEDGSAANRFKLNKELIDFRRIPKEYIDRISKILDEEIGGIVEIKKTKLDDYMVIGERR